MENEMQLSLNVKKTSSFFWLRKISDVNIKMCCAKCFYGSKVKQVYDESRYRSAPYTIELAIEPSEKYRAYYLCGLSAGMKYENNTHVAFVHAPDEQVHIETEQMEVTITNARWIDFEGADYTPDPPGEYTEEQRKCRNWIFANYLKDGKLPEIPKQEQKDSCPRTTKSELIKMLEEYPDTAQIVINVRGNSTEDYAERHIAVKSNLYGDVLTLCDRLSQ